jgi:hypothetical protein
MMKNRRVVLLGLFILCVAVSCGGCSIKHMVSDDYPQYLVNNQDLSKFPKTQYMAEYLLTQNTINHHYEFRAAMTGYAHLWIVEFGKMMETTLESADMQAAFKRLTKAVGDGTSSAMIMKYDLIDYQFEGFEARVKLRVSVAKTGVTIFDKTYFEKGLSQGGKMFWAGAFGMKNAIQQSTKSAIDKVLIQSLNDMNSSVKEN